MSNVNMSVLVMDGSKTFWKTRNYLKILIVNHPHCDCLEIIAYDPALGVEYPRIYLDVLKINSKLNENIVKAKLCEKQEALNRSKISFTREDLLKEIKLQLATQYAYNRINVEVNPATGGSSFGLLASFEDVVLEDENCVKRIDVEVDKPSSLVPFEHKIAIVKS